MNQQLLLDPSWLYGAADQDLLGVELTGGSTRALALKYVAQRHRSGHLNDRSAQQTRYRLLDFASAVPDDPARIKQRHIEQWLARPSLAPSYRRSMLSAVRGFCRWLVGTKVIRTDPTLLVEKVKVPEGLPKRLTADEARAVVAAAADDRTRLVILLMLQEALRRIEVSRLNVEDIDFAERAIMVRGKGGRGQHTDALPLSDETWTVLTRYLAAAGHTHGPLVRNKVRAHGRLAPSTISDLVRTAMCDAGVKHPGDPTKTPHSCRHTAAHDLLAQTKDVRAVQKALRHRSVRSTETYLRGHVTELRAVMAGRSYLPAT